MATAITTLATNVATHVNYQLMRGLLSTAKKRLPFFNGTVPGNLSKNQGAPAVTWERLNNLSVGSTPSTTFLLAEASGNSAWQNGRALVRPTVSTVAVTPKKYGNAIQLTEEIDLLQMNVRAMKMMDTLGANAGEVLNELMLDTYQTATQSRKAGAVATITSIVTAISANDIKYGVNLLNRNSAMKFMAMGTGSTNVGTTPIRESYYGICHPDVEEDIRGITGFAAVETYAGYMPTLPGEFGAVNGVRWCTSEIAGLIAADAGGNASTNTLRYTTTTTACDLYDSFIYGKEALGSIGLGEEHAEAIYKMFDKVPTVELIYHKAGSAGAGDPYNEISTISWKSWFAGALLNGNWVVRVRSGSSRLS